MFKADGIQLLNLEKALAGWSFGIRLFYFNYLYQGYGEAIVPRTLPLSPFLRALNNFGILLWIKQQWLWQPFNLQLEMSVAFLVIESEICF